MTSMIVFPALEVDKSKQTPVRPCRYQNRRESAVRIRYCRCLRAYQRCEEGAEHDDRTEVQFHSRFERTELAEDSARKGAGRRG